MQIFKRLWEYAKHINDRYNRHFGDLMASAVAFNALLSLVPLLSIAVFVAGMFLGNSDQALLNVQKSLQSYIPAGGQLIYDTLGEIKQAHGMAGLFGILGGLFTASAIFTKVEIAFNNVWGVAEGRDWFHGRVTAILTALLSLTLLLSSIGITSVLAYVQRARVPLFGGHFGDVPYVWLMVGILLPLLLSIALFTSLYKIVPNKTIPFHDAAIGGLFAGFAFEVAKHLFTLYLSYFNNYNKVYGSLGGIIILMVWIYYSTTLLFLGAEIAADSSVREEATPLLTTPQPADQKPESIAPEPENKPVVVSREAPEKEVLVVPAEPEEQQNGAKGLRSLPSLLLAFLCGYFAMSAVKRP